MDITMARTKPLVSVVVVRVVFQFAISLAALFALCVVAPGIYTSNAAVRAFERERDKGQILLGQLLDRNRKHYAEVLSQAEAISSPEAREAFLTNAISQAKLEWEGSQQGLNNTQNGLSRLNTLFHRITGNKLLALAQHQVDYFQEVTALAESNVEQLVLLARDTNDRR